MERRLQPALCVRGFSPACGPSLFLVAASPYCTTNVSFLIFEARIFNSATPGRRDLSFFSLRPRRIKTENGGIK